MLYIRILLLSNGMYDVKPKVSYVGPIWYI
jgi:hypothetical protein